MVKFIGQVVLEVLKMWMVPLYWAFVALAPDRGGHHSCLWFPGAILLGIIQLCVYIQVLEQAKANNKPEVALYVIGCWLFTWMAAQVIEAIKIGKFDKHGSSEMP